MKMTVSRSHLESRKKVIARNFAWDFPSVFSLQQIIDLDEKNQILTSNVWLDLTWKDAYMMWNVSDYNNITVETDKYQ